MTRKISPLAPDGFPWQAILVGVAVTLAGMAIGLYGLGVHSTGGTFVVSALIGIAAFASRLG